MPASTSTTLHSRAPEGWVRGMLVLGLATFLVYLPVFSGEFVWDDPLLVHKNPLVTGELNLLTVWFRTDFPLSLVLFWIQHLLWGTTAAGYHIVNVALHAGNAMLLWVVLSRMEVRGSWLAALLFALHPVCVASAAWISELKNTLSLFFLLLSFWTWLKAEAIAAPVDSEPPRLHRGWYTLSAVLFVLSLLSKTSTVMYPVFLLLHQWWRTGRITARGITRTLPLFLLALTFGLLTVWFQKHQVITGLTVQNENFWGRLAGAGSALWFYLFKAVIPLRLSLIYPKWSFTQLSPATFVPLLLFLLLLAACWSFRKTWGRHGFFAFAAFAVLLFPALGFFDMYFLVISRVSDHFQYLPLAVLAALAAASLARATHSNICALALPVKFAVVPGIVFALGILSFTRAGIFAKDEALWWDTLEKNPESWTARNNLGCILAEKGLLQDAIGQFTASLKINPANPRAHSNLGRALLLRNRLEEAEQHYRRAIELKPEFDVRLEYATLLLRSHKHLEAVIQLREALKLKPAHAETLNNLAWLLATSADERARDGHEAVQLARKALSLSGSPKPAKLGTLAAAYAETGQFREAVATVEEGLAAARSSRNPALTAGLERLALSFRAGKPWRE